MSIKTIYIINGPNLNLLGKRETDIYGARSFEDYLEELGRIFSNLTIHYFQSNHEGRLIDKLQEVGFVPDVGVVLNAAGFTHTSVALRDAVAAIEVPVAEVHISDIKTREAFRHYSYISDYAVFFVCGKGLAGYAEAITFLRDLN